MSDLLRGVVKWFNNAKGFGFIEHETGQDVFVHYSVIQTDGFKTLKDGEEVHYELAKGDKGLNASKVFRLKEVSSKAAESHQSSESQVEEIRTSSIAIEVENSRARSAASSLPANSGDAIKTSETA